MPSRELQYRVIIDTSVARREARSIRSAIERELRQIQIGNIDVRGFQTATDQARRLREELDRAADEQERLNRTSRARTSSASGITNIGAGQAVRELAQVAGLAFGAKQAFDFSVELSKLGTEANRTFKALEILSGGADVAAKRIDEIKEASGNTIDSLTAAGVATTILGQKLNTSITSFGELAKAARAIALLSPSINDAGDAIAQLSLFGANTKSFARADQLLVTAEEVKSRMKELAKENASLSESQLKVAATVDIVNEKFGSVLTSAEAQASGIERLTVAWKEFRIAVSTADFGPAQEFFSIDRFAGETAAALNAASKLINGESSNIEFAIDRIKGSLEFLNNEQNRFLFPADNSNEILELSNRLDLFTDVVDNVRAAVDAGVPSAAAYASTLDQMASTIGVTAGVTDDQVRALEAVNNWYNTVAQSAINAANANSENAQATTASANVQYTLAAAFDSGKISADNYVTILGTLTGQIYDVADAANIASAAIAGMGAVRAAVQSNINTYGTANPYDTIYNLNSGPSSATGVPSLGISPTDPYNTLIDILKKQSEETRKAAGYQAEQARKAAAEQERAGKRAASELEKGAKKARQELESALQSVPGLFGRSQITQSQLDRANAGLPQNFADDYLRRLQDEVFNGHDWADVSIDEAKQSLRDLGIQVADDNKIAFEQFAEAWESSVLFADEANLRFINQDAVQLQLDLQEKAKQGQENIYKLFGIAVDEAVSSVAGGISGGGGGIAASIPTAAQLIPANTDLTTIPTLGGVSVAVDIEAIRGQLNDLTVKPTFDLSEINNAQLTIRSTLGIESFAAVIEKIESTRATLSVRTDLHTESFAAVLEKVGSTKQSILVDAELNPDSNVGETIKQALAADIGATRFDGEVITPIADGLLRAINTEFAVRRADFRREGESLADVIKSALGDAIGVTEWTDGAAVAPIADGLITAINTQVRARKDAIGREGGGVAQLIKAGINESISTVDWKDGQVVAPIATGLITSINTQFRASRDLFVREGQSLSTFIMSGLSNSFQVTDPNGNTDTSIALGLVSALNSQFDASQNFFYAAGQTPASALLDGFRGSFAGGPEASAALVSPLLEGITTGIRANQQQFQQRGGTIARALMSGFTREFDSETLRNTLVAAGETMGMYLEVGILSRIRGGALVEAIGAQVLADIADTVEGTQP